MKRLLILLGANLAATAIVAGLAWMLFAPAPAEPPTVVKTPSATAAATAQPIVPETRFSADMTESQATDFFNHVAGNVAGTGSMDGAQYVQAFRDLGVPDDIIQVTSSDTTIGVPAESIQFSIRWGSTCIIGDVGHGSFTSTVAPATHWESCLLGATRPLEF